MAQVKSKDNENIESLLRRFKRKVDNEGIIKEYKSRQYFVKPSLEKRLKFKEAKRKLKVKELRKTLNRKNR